MNTRLRWTLIVFAVLALVAASCGGDDDEPDAGGSGVETDSGDGADDGEGSGDGDAGDAGDDDGAVVPEGAEPLRVAVVAPSAENDLAFSQSIVDALRRMEEAGLFSEVAVSPGVFVVEDAGLALRDYAKDGFDLVLGHGSQYGGLIEEIAPDFPDTAFAWGTSVETFGLDNVSSYTTASNEGGYVMGLMAAELAAGAPVGIIGPIEVGDAKLYVDGFKAGVEAGGGTASVVYTDSFADVQLASEAARSFIDNGHAVLTGTAQMTVGAIGAANDNGIPWFGTQSNQTQVAPEVVVANQVYKWDVVLDDLVRDIATGQMGGQEYEINFANGGLVIEYNDDYDLPDAVRAAADAAISGLIDGSMSTGIG